MEDENTEIPEDLELPEIEDTAWRETAIAVGTDFFIIYGVIALIRDIAKFMCNK